MFNKAIELDPNFHCAYYNKGYIINNVIKGVSFLIL